jgi:hypothetical protein
MRFCSGILLVESLVVVSAAVAGPNAGGVLVVHDTGVAWSAGMALPPVTPPPASCSEVDNNAPLTPIVWKVYAVFPQASSPRLASMCWGVGINKPGTSDVSILGWGLANTGDYEVTDGVLWPNGGGEGTAFTAGTRTATINEVYWFGGCGYAGSGGELPTFCTMRWEAGSAIFVDDAPIAQWDPIAGFGCMGFGHAGYTPCPPGPAVPTAILELLPSKIAVYQPCGGAFPVELRVNDVEHLAGFEACTGYDGMFLGLDSVVVDPTFLGRDGRAVYPLNPVSCTPTCQSSGIQFGAVTTGAAPAPSGGGPLARLYFRPPSAGSGTSHLCLEDVEMADPGIPPVPIEVLEVRGAEITPVPHCYGDFNGDGDVTSLDLLEIKPRWHCRIGDAGYMGAFDVNQLRRGDYCASFADSSIDVVDVQTVAGRWGQGCPGPAPSSGPADSTGAVRILPARPYSTVSIGDTMSVALAVEDGAGLGAFEAEVRFDPAVLHAQGIQLQDFLARTGRTVYRLGPSVDNLSGRLVFGMCTTGSAPGVGGDGALFRIVFRIENCNATTKVSVGDLILTSVDGWPQAVGAVSDGSISIGCLASVPEASGDGEPARVALLPNRPNPLTSGTEIPFSIPGIAGAGAHVQVAIYDAMGRLIRSLCDRDLGPGRHSVEWDGRDASGGETSSGVYFCRLTCRGTVVTRQISLIR